MRLGVVVQVTRPWHELRQEFAWAEAVGYDVAYVYDHLTHPTARGGWLAEAFGTLAAAAGVTSRMELGTLVASATLHSPVSLERRAATVQDVSDGRLVLGLGAGSPRCTAADRGESTTPKEMYERLEDVVVGMRAVWDGATEWEGRTRSFSGLETTAFPDGARPPFLLLAAHGPRAMRLAVREGDGWNTYGGPDSVSLEAEDYWDLVAGQVQRIERLCAEHDRDDDLRRSLLLGYGKVQPTQSPAAYLEAVERADDLGFDELVVYGPGAPGQYLGSDPETHEQALTALGRG